VSTQPTYYKILGDDGVPYLGTDKWHLPKGKRPGKWMPVVENISMCRSGYHVVEAEHIADFLKYGYHIFEVEVRGDQLRSSNKLCVSQARLLRLLDWSESRARLFACDCAERALDLFGGEVDPRSREAIEVARRFARGEATLEELRAARDAAGDAAWAAARNAARDAARDAAWAAARNAAWDAAGDAAGAVERKWQTARLLDYLYGRVV